MSLSSNFGSGGPRALKSDEIRIDAHDSIRALYFSHQYTTTRYTRGTKETTTTSSTKLTTKRSTSKAIFVPWEETRLSNQFAAHAAGLLC